MSTVVHHGHVFDTALGPMGIAWSEDGLTRIQLPDRDADSTARRLTQRPGAKLHDQAPPEIAAAVTELTAYASGTRTAFASIRLSFAAVPEFNARIYQALREIPWGETTTYGTLAKAVGEPGAARAVGMAMGRNPWPIIVPCHRVLAAAKRIGGFSAPGGATTKERLLRLEGSTWSGNDPDEPTLPGLLDHHT